MRHLRLTSHAANVQLLLCTALQALICTLTALTQRFGLVDLDPTRPGFSISFHMVASQEAGSVCMHRHTMLGVQIDCLRPSPQLC